MARKKNGISRKEEEGILTRRARGAKAAKEIGKAVKRNEGIGFH